MSNRGREDPGHDSLPARIRWAAGAARLILRQPGDGLDRAYLRVRRLLTGVDTPVCGYDTDPQWEQHLHDRLGHPWPCQGADEFDTLWSEVTSSLEAQGLSVGRGAYGGWDDGDRGFARAVWCLTRHLPARTVVETGVARGITSRVILEALTLSGAGRLFSIDLPALDNALHSEIGAAVPTGLRERWTYVRGTSRNRLRGLLGELGPIDLFVHDSSHTARNLRFELGCAWSALDRGAIVADDIQRNPAFGEFTRARPQAVSLVAAADDGEAQFGIVLKGV